MADWKIINGNLPFKDDFPTRPTSFDDYPDWIWHKVVDELPYKAMFPTRYAIDDAPEAMWKISDDLPFKTSFATRYPINEAPMALWMKYSGELPFKVVFPKMPPPPKMEKPYVRHQCPAIVLSEYKQRIKFSEVYVQTVILPTYKSIVITEEW